MAGEKTLEDVMQFDPFSPSEGETGEEPEGQEQNQGSGADAEPGSSSEPAPQDPPSDGEEGGDEEIPPQEEPSSQAPGQQQPQPGAQAPDLQAQIAALQAMLAQQRQQPQPQQQPQQPEAPKPPRFNLAIPPQLQQGINSEDPAESGAAMHALVNGVANAIWKEFESTVQELEQRIMSQVPQVAQQQSQTIAEQQRVAQDFYGTYPQFNIPAMKPVVQQVAQGLAQQQAAMGMPVQWNAQFRDMVAAQLFQMFPMLTQGQGQGQKPVPNGQAGAPRTAAKPKAQSFASGRGTRPQTNPGDPQVNDIMDTLDLR